MSTNDEAAPPIAPNRFAVGFYRQCWWNWRIGAAFFFGEIGAGLFLISLLTGHVLGMLVGYLIVIAGKNTAHLLYLGRPGRFWRAAMRPDRSWIARGIWATGIFGIAGLVCLAPYFSLGLALPALAPAARLAAAVAALFIMFYDGMVMKASSSIASWNTALLPVLCLTYGSLGGATLSITVREIQGLEVPGLLVSGELWLLAINFLLLLLYVTRMKHWIPAAQQAMQLLLRGRYRSAFLGLVLLVGIGATYAFSLLHSRLHSAFFVGLVAVCELVGDFSLVMVLLKSGLFAPQVAPEYACNQPETQSASAQMTASW
jgi:formate-dependent nitrite reductase membrane component NrfD